MIRTVALVSIFVFATGQAHAQVTRSGGGDASARLQAMLQQERANAAALTADKQRLETQVGKLEAKVAALESQLAASSRSEQSLKQKVTVYASSVEQKDDALERSRGQFQELLDKSREIATNLRDCETRGQDLDRQVQERRQELEVCGTKNASLAALNEDIIAYLRNDEGTLSDLLRREPFTGIKQTRRENLADDYEYQAQDLVMEQK
jgi:chromosome segregation ATPase